MRDLRTVALVALFLIAFLSARAHRGLNVDFGVNGHPLNSGPYSELSLEQQIDLLAAPSENLSCQDKPYARRQVRPAITADCARNA